MIWKNPCMVKAVCNFWDKINWNKERIYSRNCTYFSHFFKPYLQLTNTEVQPKQVASTEDPQKTSCYFVALCSLYLFLFIFCACVLSRLLRWKVRTIALSWWMRCSMASKCWSCMPGSWPSKTRCQKSVRVSCGSWRKPPIWLQYPPSPGSVHLSWWVQHSRTDLDHNEQMQCMFFFQNYIGPPQQNIESCSACTDTQASTSINIDWMKWQNDNITIVSVWKNMLHLICVLILPLCDLFSLTAGSLYRLPYLLLPYMCWSTNIMYLMPRRPSYHWRSSTSSVFLLTCCQWSSVVWCRLVCHYSHAENSVLISWLHFSTGLHCTWCFVLWRRIFKVC